MRLAVWLTPVMIICTLGSASAVETSGFTQGQWIGAAHATDVGAFSYCDAGTLFKNGTSLILAKDRSTGWSMALSDQRWHLPAGYHYPLQVRFDGGPWLGLDSSAESPSLLRIVLPADGTFLAMIQRGHSIQITSGSFDKRYDLEGSADAVARLDQCVRESLQREAAAKDNAKAASQALFVLGAVGVGVYLTPMVPMLVIAALASPDYHPQLVAPPAETGVTSPTKESHDLTAAVDVAGPVPTTATPLRTEVPLREDMGTYRVPVEINGIVDVDFTVDSGASAVVIPDDVFKRLMRGGTISAADFLGQDTFVLADGSTSTLRTFRIKSLQVGDTVLTDIVGSVAPEGGSLLLGQTFLSRFRSWSMDNGRHVLVLEEAR